MTVAEARAELEMFTRASSFPTLTSDEIDLLLKQAKRASMPFAAGVNTGQPLNNGIMIVSKQGTVPPDSFADWEATTVYVAGDQVVPTVRNGHFYEVTVGGTSGSSEPTFPTDDGDTVTDGSVTWQEAGAALWIPTFVLPPSISKGWKLKAAKVSGAYDFKTDDQQFSRSQMFKQLMEMAAQWAQYGQGTIELQGSIRERRGSGVFPVGNNDWLWNDDDEPLSSTEGFAVRNIGGGRTVWTDDY